MYIWRMVSTIIGVEQIMSTAGYQNNFVVSILSHNLWKLLDVL